MQPLCKNMAHRRWQESPSDKLCLSGAWHFIWGHIKNAQRRKVKQKCNQCAKNMTHRCRQESPSDKLCLPADRKGQHYKKGTQKLKVMKPYQLRKEIKVFNQSFGPQWAIFSEKKFLSKFQPQRARPGNWFWLKICCFPFSSSSRSHSPLSCIFIKFKS